MNFRYYRDPVEGWRFADEGVTPVSLFPEFTDGRLNLSRFVTHLPVVGHFGKGEDFFILYKPAGKDEMLGRRLSRLEYGKFEFDPFTVASATFDVVVPNGESPNGGGPWSAVSSDYLGGAASLFRQLSPAERERATAYLSLLPHDASPAALPQTRFIQDRDEPAVTAAPIHRDRGTGVNETSAQGAALENLGAVVKEQDRVLRLLQAEVRELTRLDRAQAGHPPLSPVQNLSPSDTPDQVQAPPSQPLRRYFLSWVPTGVVALLGALLLLVGSVTHNRVQEAATTALGAQQDAEVAAASAASQAELAVGAADTANKAADAALGSQREATNQAEGARASSVSAASQAELAAGSADTAAKTVEAVLEIHRAVEQVADKLSAPGPNNPGMDQEVFSPTDE